MQTNCATPQNKHGWSWEGEIAGVSLSRALDSDGSAHRRGTVTGHLLSGADPAGPDALPVDQMEPPAPGWHWGELGTVGGSTRWPLEVGGRSGSNVALKRLRVEEGPQSCSFRRVASLSCPHQDTSSRPGVTVTFFSKAHTHVKADKPGQSSRKAGTGRKAVGARQMSSEQVQDLPPQHAGLWPQGTGCPGS